MSSANFENLKQSTKKCAACGVRMHMSRLGGWSNAPEVLQCYSGACYAYGRVQFDRKPGTRKWLAMQAGAEHG